MADVKKYYWLKLHKDFFKRHEIKVIEDMPNGKDYILFYLKLLVESVSHNGNLRFSDAIPYNEQMLSSITNTNIDIVRAAMQVFLQLNMIEVLDDETIYMSEVDSMIGSESASAQRVRKHRENQKLLHCNNDVTESNTENAQCNIEIRDKSIEIRDKNNISISNDIDCQTDAVRQVISAWNTLSEFGVKPVSKMASTSTKYKSLVARIKQHNIDDVLKAIENIKNSDFLTGKSTDWIITFDWFVMPNNFVKVLDGNYDNRTGSGKGTVRY